MQKEPDDPKGESKKPKSYFDIPDQMAPSQPGLEAGGDVEEHRNSLELDHPTGSVQIRHLEQRIRALLEQLVQGENEVRIREEATFGEDVAFEGSLTIGVDGAVVGKLTISTSAPSGGSDGDIWLQREA